MRFNRFSCTVHCFFFIFKNDDLTLFIMIKFYTILLVFAGLVIFSNSYAQIDSEYLDAKKYLDKKGEVYFHFHVNSPQPLLDLTNIISIDNVKNGEVWAYANRKEFPEFLTRNIPYQVLPHPGDVEVEMYDAAKGIWQFDTYPTYPEYETMMNTFATNYPNICHLDTIATLASGRRLLVLKITDNPNVDENEPEFLYTGTMHGDETTGYVTFLRLINYLLTNYGTNARVTNIVNNIELWVCPLANPDGTYAGGNTTVTGSTRSNANGIDLNRNYPDPNAGQHPDGNAWQPETVAWMNFANNHDFVMSANTHGGASVFNYPWDTWTSAQHTHADNNWWLYVGNEFADTCQANGSAGYFTDVAASGVTEGGDWYVITGGRQDYMNYFKHCREVTLEISTTKTVAANQLPNYWNYTYRSFLNYLEQSLYGVKGVITDACTGNPIKALVTVNTHDIDSSQVYSSLPVGNYHRPILAGTYSFTYSASGYQSQTITNITVANKATAIRNVQMVPLAPVADFTADHTSGCDASIQFTNSSQTPAGSTYLWDFGDGQTSTLENPSHSYSGTGNYTVTLTVNNSCTGSDQMVKTNYITLSLPAAPTTLSKESCGSSSLTLNASGTGTLNWYDAPSGGNLVNTGTSYTTPVLTTTTTYYVESSTTQPSQYVGNTQSSTGGSIFTAPNEHYLVFDCTTACTLVSVEVNASTAGNRVIELRDASGTTLQTTTVNIPAGVSRIALNFNIPVGTSLRLVGPGSPNLWRSNAGVSYPYTLAGLVSINNSDAGTLYYYYFYDWEIQTPGCSSARVPVTATIKPIPTAFAGTDQNLCPGNTASLTATGGGTYLWSTSQSTATISVSPSSTTIYTVTVTNAQGCSATDAVTVTVLPALVANAGADQSIPGNTSASLTGSATGGTGSYTYHWEPASLLVNPDVFNPVTVTLSSTTQFILTVSDQPQGCIAYDTVFITVSGSTLNVSTSASPQTICSGNSSQLTANASGGSGSYTYQWESSPAGLTSTVSNPVVNPIVNTTYTVTVSDGSATNVSSVTVNVNPLPVSNFNVSSSGLNIILTNQSANATSYMWYFGDGGLSSQANPNYNYATDGNYTITLIATNSCGNDTTTQTITIAGIGNIFSGSNNIFVYPNPTSGLVNITLQENVAVSLSDVTGRIIYLQSFDKLNTLDLTFLSDGLYYLTFTSQKQKKVIPLIVAH